MELGWIVASPAHRVLPKTCGAEEIEASISCRSPEADSSCHRWKVPPCVCWPGVRTSQNTRLEGFRHSELGQLTLITSPSGSVLALDLLHASKVPAENSWTCFSPLEKTRQGATFPVRSGDEALKQLLALLSLWP